MLHTLLQHRASVSYCLLLQKLHTPLSAIGSGERAMIDDVIVVVVFSLLVALKRQHQQDARYNRPDYTTD